MFTPKTLLGLCIAAATLCQIQSIHAQNYYVGTCKPGKGTFYTSIQQAVNLAPAGVTINICPGTYAEQITIEQPLTLKGMQNGNSAAVTITAPTAELSPFPVSNLFFGGAAQVQVINSGGPVNISGITVDGTGVINGQAAGILYESSPGTLDHVITKNLAAPVGVAEGIRVLDDSAVSPTVTIQNSFLSHNSSGGGGVTVSAGGSNLVVNVANNYILQQGGAGIACDGQAPGTVTGNVIFGANEGVVANCLSVTISGNTISSGIGILVERAATISGNTINATSKGVDTGGDTGTVIKGNQIFNARIGIDLVCALPATISGNQFIGTALGLADVPTGTTLDKSAGSFFGVPTVLQLCN